MLCPNGEREKGLVIISKGRVQLFPWIETQANTYLKEAGKPNSLVETFRNHTSTISGTSTGTGVDKNPTNQSETH